MPRTSRTQPPPPQYLTTQTGTGHQVTDRLNGYPLSEHPTAEAAQAAAEQLNTDPAAAIAAARALDDEQTGPAADVRRLLRRYGYGWCLVQSDAAALHSRYQLREYLEAGHLVMVWSHRGLPFYTTPERYRELRIVFQEDERELIPTAVESTLQRHRERLNAMPRSQRYAVCETHAYSVGHCCPPREEWECDWGGCSANAVTKIAGRPVCEGCAHQLAYVSGVSLPRTA
ncbi:hypothetical protein [Streptomyces sp. NPDC005408]|uniref:hypothetical protein n=1 Tax=Streptomyces sp. NPDC005408 TaxID=3155341 RepID=UPI0033B3B655